jgi:hypothetical protein
MPVQMLPLKDKDQEWKIACMDALESIGRKQFLDNIEILENYRMVNNELLYNHYVFTDAVTDLAEAATKEWNLPPYLRHYDILGKVVKVLSGEYQQRPDIFRVAAVDEFSTNSYLEQKKNMTRDMVIGKIQDNVKKQLIKEGLDPDKKDFKSQDEQQQYMQQMQAEQERLTPESIEGYMKETYLGIPEKWGEMVLKLDKRRFNTPEMDMVEFEDMLISDRAYRHFYLKANGLGYAQETWNPIRVFWHKSPDIKYVEDGDYVGRVFYLSIPEIINRYGYKMKKAQLEDLYGDYLRKKKMGGAEYSFFQATNVPFENYPEYARTVQAFGFDPHSGVPYTGSLGNITNQDVDVLFNSSSTSYNLAGLTLCTEGYWRSQVKQGFLIMKDPETGEVTEEIVDETFIVPDHVKEVSDDEFSNDDLVYHPEKMMNTIRWTWMNQIYGGIKVNVASQDKDTVALYIDVKPLPYQLKGDINPYECKLPVCGAIFNNRNAKSMSLVGMGKPYQILYNVFMNKIFELASTDMGKILALNPKAIPNDKDWGGDRNLQKWITATKGSRIAQVDNSPGSGVAPGQPAITVVDGTTFDQIRATVEIAALIEQQFLFQVGVTQQRLGQATQANTATEINEALKSSYNSTESYFTRFSNYKKRVMQMNLDMAQYCAATNRDQTLMLIQDDMAREFMTMNGTELLNSQLGVMVFSSNELVRQLDMLKTLVLKNNTSNTPMSSLAEVIFTESPARIIQTLRKAEAALIKQGQQAQQARQDEIKQKYDREDQIEAKKQAFEAEQKQLDRNNDIQLATLKATGAAELGSGDTGAETVINQGKLELDRSRLDHDRSSKQLEHTQKIIEGIQKSTIEKERIKTDKSLKDQEANIKKQEMANKKEIEDQKLEQIVTQNKNQELLSKNKHSADIALKDKDLEMKNKELEIKKIEHGHKKTINELDKKSALHDLEVQKKLAAHKIETEKKLTDVKIEQTRKLSNEKIAQTKKLGRIKITQANKTKPKTP